MKILHVCLAAFYIDNYGYQENILPKMHKLQGHEVMILASTEIYIDNSKLGYTSPKSYTTNEGIPIIRIPYVRWLPHAIVRKLRVYSGIKNILIKFKPDILFVHDSQFVSIIQIASYAKRNPHIKIYVDGHADFIKHKDRNWIVNYISQKILHGIIYKWCAQKIEPYTRKFYGVLPIRVDFIINTYGIKKRKVELLVMGADDTAFNLSQQKIVRKRIRDKLNIKDNIFLIVTGGKIEPNKRIEILMQAVKEINNPKIMLVVFGSIIPQMKKEIENLAKSERIKYVSWISGDEVYDYFLASDLGFFPGTHSVLWEQAVGVGLPCVFKEWPGETHVNVGGNCMFINIATIDEIKKTILLLYNNKSTLMNMKKVAIEKAVKYFSYYDIAKRAIEK